MLEATSYFLECFLHPSHLLPLTYLKRRYAQPPPSFFSSTSSKSKISQSVGEEGDGKIPRKILEYTKLLPTFLGLCWKNHWLQSFAEENMY
jgi:hypothetical protein